MTGAIILAAGSSSRMGQSKQMLDIDGEKLLTRTVKAVLEAGIRDIVVVLGADEKAHREILKDVSVNVIGNADWEKGMGSSIRTGLRFLTEKIPGVENAMILVCDQPLLTADVVSRLLQHHQQTGKHVTASGYSNTAGVPVLFDNTYFQKLNSLADDQGAKKIILENPSDVVVVPFQGGEVDLDTIEDYNWFLKNRG